MLTGQSHHESDEPARFNWTRVLVVAVAYLVSARLSLMIAFEGGVASPIWPPSGIALGAMLLWGWRVWPGVLLGAFGATAIATFDPAASTHMPGIITAAGIGIGNTVEALAGAFLFHRIVGPRPTLDRARDAFAFSGIAGVMCLVASTIGPMSAYLTGISHWDTLETTWFTWWLGDVTGVLTVTPLLFRWRVVATPTHRGRSIAESGALVALLVSVGVLAFGGMFPNRFVGFVGYLIIPILLWIVFRSSQRYAAVAVAGVAAATAFGTSRGYGPFVVDSLNTSLLIVQGFVCTLSITLLVVSTAVTERRRADVAVHSAQRHQDVILRTVPLALYTASPDEFGTTWISSHVEAICGFAADAFVDGPGFWSSRLHPADKARTIRAIENARAGAQVRVEYRWKCANGEYRWFLDYPQLIPATNGKPSEILGTWRDITDEKTASIALLASESRMKAILEHSPAIITLKDSDGRYLLANQKLSELTGVAPREILDKTDADLFTKEFADKFHESDRAVRDHGDIVEFVQTIPSRGDVRTYLTLKFPIHEVADSVPVVCAISTDITDRSRAEEALASKSREVAALAEELSTLLAHTRDFVYRHNAVGVFEYASPSIKQITGFSPGEWHRHYTKCLTDNPINEIVIGNTEKALRTGIDPSPYLVEIYHKDGHAITLELNERCYFKDGKVGGIIGVARDVTERIRAEKELKQARDAADAASRVKSVFLANLSHELRTPIMAIMGAAELTATAGREAMPIAACREIAVRNGQHLLTLINDLLDVAQMESGKIDIVRRRCSLVEIVANVHAATASLPDAAHVELRFSYESEIPESIETDPTRLTQAIINLVANALKFTRQGYAHVSIAVGRDQPDPRLTIRVEDTGDGIPTDAHEHIFENFVQVGERRDGVVGGVGLGLPLAKAISEQLGGALRVESRIGTGSVFTLAVATGDLTDVAWIKPPDFAGGSSVGAGASHDTHLSIVANILLAEDFPDTRDLLRISLEAAGASVVAVENGQEAVNAAKKKPFDLILLDIRMPVMDGREAVRRLREDGCLAPTIAMTASTMASEYESLLADGFDDVWQKPLTLADLMAKVATYTRSTPEVSAQPATLSDETRAKLAKARVSYVQALPARVTALRRAATNADREALYEQLHQLTGSAGMHDLDDISHEAARLSAIAKTGAMDGHPQELDCLAAMVESAVQSL